MYSSPRAETLTLTRTHVHVLNGTAFQRHCFFFRDLHFSFPRWAAVFYRLYAFCLSDQIAAAQPRSATRPSIKLKPHNQPLPISAYHVPFIHSFFLVASHAILYFTGTVSWIVGWSAVQLLGRKTFSAFLLFSAVLVPLLMPIAQLILPRTRPFYFRCVHASLSIYI